ncbi:hypothetical protein HanRHA438_Chr06g0274701 [Helianthus annuus]|nr:hypothetical protein HanIR_Chr06g0285651 [Helianthus annuus]KAJ0741259.1 hypothetical protein HanOQP8_Chr06g0226041 [Helianthus annuus]KAJ0780768.1 hypothetical protein HanPI659440_Chr06g0241521 [Helianthus annuus]KAJ0912469.1 hypothetical protein HanRHA438_Chr06g0274701 [Helianthus annuus]
MDVHLAIGIYLSIKTIPSHHCANEKAAIFYDTTTSSFLSLYLSKFSLLWLYL